MVKVSAFPGFRVQAVDTIAAGDTFNGALITALLEEKPLPEAIRFAHAAAAIAVTRKGAQPSVPWREEIDAFFRQAEVTLGYNERCCPPGGRFYLNSFSRYQ